MDKNIYFLRHGQTEGNKKWIHQSPETPLSEEGKNEAQAIGEKIKDYDIDVVITSPLERAYQTAVIVNKMFSAPLETNEFMVELKKPSVLEGESWFSPHSVWVMGQLYLRANNKDWHHSDEENLGEFQERAFKALQCVSNRPEKNILVVTHRGLMANMMSCIKNDGLTSVARYKMALWKNLGIGNACIFEASWSPEGEWGETLNGTWTHKEDYVCPFS